MQDSENMMGQGSSVTSGAITTDSLRNVEIPNDQAGCGRNFHSHEIQRISEQDQKDLRFLSRRRIANTIERL